MMFPVALVLATVKMALALAVVVAVADRAVTTHVH